LIYVSSPGDEALDQELDDCLVGPIPQGVNSFEFEGSAPQPSIIPKEDVLGVAALILTGSYRDQEFVRVGYYQNTEYEDESLKADPPSQIQFERLVRDINTKPRVTRFQIKWCVSQSTFAAQKLILNNVMVGTFYLKVQELPRELRHLPLYHRPTTLKAKMSPWITNLTALQQRHEQAYSMLVTNGISSLHRPFLLNFPEVLYARANFLCYFLIGMDRLAFVRDIANTKMHHLQPLVPVYAYGIKQQSVRGIIVVTSALQTDGYNGAIHATGRSAHSTMRIHVLRIAAGVSLITRS